MPRPKFDYTLDYKNLNLREHPELYRVGKGEQGVLIVEPYKSELLPHWRFKTEEIAKESAEKIYTLFEQYLASGDFVGMDMARKFLQMGYTRARRYANHPSGTKYSNNDKENPRVVGKLPPYNQRNQQHYIKTKTKEVLPQAEDALQSEKARAARVFYGYYVRARENPEYQKAKKAHQDLYG